MITNAQLNPDDNELEREALKDELERLSNLLNEYKKENESLRRIVKDQWNMLKGHLGLG